MTRNDLISLITTVNVPYRIQMDGDRLVAALRGGEFTQGQVYSFFTEIETDKQWSFARHYDMSDDEILSIARSFAECVGHMVDILEDTTKPGTPNTVAHQRTPCLTKKTYALQSAKQGK